MNGTRERQPPMDPREAELNELRAKLRTYEAQNGGQSGSGQTNNNPTNAGNPKNGPMAQRETGPNPINSEITNMRNYLAEVMAAISGFESRLSAQQEQPPTPSDRS